MAEPLEREEFRAVRYYSTATIAASMFLIPGVALGLIWRTPVPGIVFAGLVLGTLWRAARPTVVVDQSGVRVDGTVVPWVNIDGVEETGSQARQWLRSRPPSRLRLRLSSLPEGWLRPADAPPFVEVPVVDDEDGLTRAIEQRLTQHS